jgi:hypothetical protein
MKVYPLLSRLNPSSAEHVSRLSDLVKRKCAASGKPPTDAKVVVLWGGGKDSTIALALAAAVCELTECELVAVTMDNPGLSQGTLENIERVSSRLNACHEFWHFRERVAAPRLCDADWIVLYQRLAIAVSMHPRFMCLACNFASIVTEYSALVHHHADFRVTGNTATEFDEFDRWLATLRDSFSAAISFPEIVQKPVVDYFRFWHAIYIHLLHDLFANTPTISFTPELVEKYLYPLPQANDTVGAVNSLPVMGDNSAPITAHSHRELLSSLGWLLPDDIQGGTESDCSFTAAIATLNIARNSLAVHLQDLAAAADRFQPLPEMTDRATQWALDGTSQAVGSRLLTAMGIAHPLQFVGAPSSKLAVSLAAKLFKIR